jgi:formiminotetrahydrofolate cyclodeaminase
MNNYKDAGEMFADLAVENQQAEMELKIKEIVLTAPEKLALFQTTKDERRAFVESLINALNEGELKPLDIHLQIKSMEDIISQLTDRNEKTNKNFTTAIRYNQLLLEAAEQYHQKSFEYQNAKIELKEVGTKYDYSQCNDAEYSELVAQQKEITEKVKAKERFLQTVPVKGIVITNDETGETYTVYPPSKKSTTSVAISLK